MAWETVTVETDGGEFSGHQNGLRFNVTFSCGLGVGETFKVDGKTYTIASATDIGGRGETLELITEMVNDKPKARRTGRKSSKSDVSLSDDDGHDDEDRDQPE